MNSGKLARQLKKELTRNPKKTIALALVTLVALWFWAPLLGKWFGDDKKKRPRPVAKAAAESPAATSADTAETVVAPAVPRLAWDTFVEQLGQDPLMQTAVLKTKMRDPFQDAGSDAGTATQDVGLAQTPGMANPMARPGEATPADLGLTLLGTLVSARGSKANIGGRIYRPGETIAEEAGLSPAHGFLVAQIQPKRVVLERAGKSYELTLDSGDDLQGVDQLSFESDARSP